MKMSKKTIIMTGIILAVAIFIVIGAIDSAIHVNNKAIERMNAYGSSSSNSKYILW